MLQCLSGASSLRRYWSDLNDQYVKSTWNRPLTTTRWRQILSYLAILSYSRKTVFSGGLENREGPPDFFFIYSISSIIISNVFQEWKRVFDRFYRKNPADFLQLVYMVDSIMFTKVSSRQGYSCTQLLPGEAVHHGADPGNSEASSNALELLVTQISNRWLRRHGVRAGVQ